jgi:hypothetical protein
MANGLLHGIQTSLGCNPTAQGVFGNAGLSCRGHHYEENRTKFSDKAP